MKKIFLWGAFTLFSSTLFSCTADELETAADKTEVKKEISPIKGTQAEGPEDDPVVVPPPKKP